jgi:hypothetical protein
LPQLLTNLLFLVARRVHVHLSGLRAESQRF